MHECVPPEHTRQIRQTWCLNVMPLNSDKISFFCVSTWPLCRRRSLGKQMTKVSPPFAHPARIEGFTCLFACPVINRIIYFIHISPDFIGFCVEKKKLSAVGQQIWCGWQLPVDLMPSAPWPIKYAQKGIKIITAFSRNLMSLSSAPKHSVARKSLCRMSCPEK